jgi:chromosomal replication initiation ATPase DnaA
MTQAQKYAILDILHEQQDSIDADKAKLTRLITAMQRVKCEPVTRQVVSNHSKLQMSEVVADYLSENGITPVDSSVIYKAVEDVTGVSLADLMQHDRRRFIVDARHLACGLIYANCPRITMNEIAQSMNKHHTTVVHSIKMFNVLSDSVPSFAAQRRATEELINNFRALSSVRNNGV